MRKEKQTKTTTVTKKKGKTKILPFSLNECGIRESGDRFLGGTRNFFSLSQTKKKKLKKTF